MKELLKRLSIGCVGFLFVYLICSFYNVTFDISKWGKEIRFISCLLGSFSFIMFSTYPNYNFKNK